MFLGHWAEVVFYSTRGGKYASKKLDPGPSIFFPHHHDIPFSDLTCQASPPSAAMLALKSSLIKLVVLETIF